MVSEARDAIEEADRVEGIQRLSARGLTAGHLLYTQLYVGSNPTAPTICYVPPLGLWVSPYASQA
jgi:hypothetical protein